MVFLSTSSTYILLLFTVFESPWMEPLYHEILSSQCKAGKRAIALVPMQLRWTLGVKIMCCLAVFVDNVNME